MTLVALSPQWLVLVLIALLAAAAFEDAIRLRISNLTCLAILLAAGTAMALAGAQTALWQNALVFTGLLLVGTPLFAAGKMGGGDVKLLAATGLWFDLQSAFMMLILVLVAGGILALFIVLMRLFGWSEETRKRVEVLRRGGGIPYGVAISCGAILAIALARGWG